jgi:DnaJ-class molecular chaperone
MNFKEIDEARKLLGLGETATLKEITTAYRRMAHLYHPDKKQGDNPVDAEMIKKLNRVNKVLTDYCDKYKFSFRQEDVDRVYPEEKDFEKWRDIWPF